MLAIMIISLLILLFTEEVFCEFSSKESFIKPPVHGIIPVINIEAWTRKNRTYSECLEIAYAVDKACSEIGFFVVKGHSIPQDAIQKIWNISAEFFDLSLDEKLAIKSSNVSEYPYGYEHSERLQLGMDGKFTNGTPDSKETFSLGPSNPKSGMPPRQLPSVPVGFQESMEHYYSEMESLSLVLLSIFAVSLGLSEDWFVAKMSHHMSALRILNYFPLNPDAAPFGSIRASPHTDYGALTILKSGGPGLQVKMGGIESDVWMDVPELPDVFIINIGDMMQRWTNGKVHGICRKSYVYVSFYSPTQRSVWFFADRWVSTLHRVVVPKGGLNAMAQRRQSIAYFCNVNGDTIVQPISTCVDHGKQKDVYGAVIARDYLMAKHLASMAADLDDRDAMPSVKDEL